MAKSEKKPKEKKPPLEEGSAAPSTAVSNSSVFGSLFGGIPEENSKASIFSNSNPFRRKPGDHSETSADQKKDLGLGSESPNVKKMESLEISDGSAEVKKRKRDKEKKGDGDAATPSPSEEEDGNVKKLKRVQGSGRKNGNMGSEGEAKEVNGVSGYMVLNGEKGKGANSLRELVDERVENNAEKKKKKKRKRDEVEAEYEARRYGVEEGEEVKDEGGGVVGRKRKEMDSLNDIMVESKEGFDDESKLLRTVFVGNLPLKIKKKLLIKEFGKFGEVESVRIRSIPLNDVSFILAFILGL